MGVKTLTVICAVVLAALVGCSSNDDPASYVTGLRVLAIKAEPPEAPVGGTSTLTALAIDTAGTPIDISWAQCLDPPLSGQSLNPDCITNDSADYLRPVGSGLSVMTTMPMIDPTHLGRPDASGGVYLPLIARIVSGTDSLTATHLLRLGRGASPNHNPSLSGLFQVTDAGDGGAGQVVSLDDAMPLVVHAGDEITLRATFMPGSAESYQVEDGDPSTTPPRTLTETLSVSWFSTAGDFSAASSGADVPDTILHLKQTRNGPSLHVPASGSSIDLWVVARDERGGADYLHRSLRVE